MATAAGLDGCPGGWVCVMRGSHGGRATARILPHVADLLHLEPRPDAVAIDIPIGLPDAGPRACDQAARALLGRPRGSSVFPAPVRPMLAARDYADACRIGLAADGRKLSRQAWNILPKIREVDAFLREDASRRDWMREVHPEVSFLTWNAGSPMRHAKKTRDGRTEREALIAATYGTAVAEVMATLDRRLYRHDDLLDAFAALWTAERILAGAAITLPGAPPRDTHGLRMEIVA